MGWLVYILECGDGSFYTGITNDMERRFKEHSEGKGAKYTRGRSPLKIVYTEDADGRSSASKREIEIKSLKLEDKLKLIAINN